MAHQHPDRLPSSALDWFSRLVLAFVAMALISTAIAAFIAVVLLVTVQPLLVAVGGIVALLLFGVIAGQLSRWIKP